MDEDEAVSWLPKHLQQSYEPLLASHWIPDSDVTIKPVYGHLEGAEVGYNPHKPGRPSHTYHTYMEAKGMPYLFTLRKSKNVKNLIYKHHSLGHWQPVKAGWEAKED
jgi:hypothetical protein